MTNTMVAVKKNVPALRFSGFDGEWEDKKLGELINSLDAGISVNSGDRIAISNEKAILKTSCVSNGIFEIFQNKVVIQEKELIRLKESLLANTIIISRMNTPMLVGANAFVANSNSNIYLPDRLWAAKINNKTNPLWLSILLSSKKIRLALSNRASGTSGSMKNITKGDVLTLSVLIPKIEEQQKIANFLSNVDKQISLLSQKKKALETYKKGVMQQLFSREIRFKDDDGSAFPDWEEKRLGEVGTTFNGLTGKTKEHFGRGEKYIQYKQIFDNSKIDISKCGLVDVNQSESQNKVQYGDVFFTVSSETPKEIGMSSVYLDRIEEDIYLNSFCFGYRPNVKLYPYFSIFLFRSSIVRKEIIKLAQGSTRYNMSKIQLLKIKIQFPSLQEQEKIANFLSNIDKQITAVNQQIAQSKTYKKGLLQEMFV